MEELTLERRRSWISAISRENLTDFILENDRVCSKHFVSGESAKDWDRFNVDWFPTLCLGHSKQQLKDPETAEVRSRRAVERRKRQSELLEKVIKEKMLKIDEPGESVEERPFSEEPVLGGNLDKDGAIDAEEANSEIEDESEASLDREQTTVDAGTQTVNSDFKVKTETHAATQADEFEYLFKETVVQPFTEEHFVNNENRVRFYTGLPGFDLLNTTFRFVGPFVSRKSKTLTLFQEFVMVLIKLRLNVPLRDLAFRFGVSLSPVSRTFTA